MSEAFDLTTYYAKRIIGDTAASDAENALLQTGSGVTGDTWILHRDNRTSKKYGIKYAYDSDGNDKIEYYGKNANDNATAWIQLNTGDASFNSILGKVEVTNTAIPSTGTAYYFPYITGNTTNTYGLLSSSRLYLYEASNTTYFCIGATDRTGGLTIRNANGKYADIVTSAFSANRTLTLPNEDGTFALMTNTDINALINLLGVGNSVLTGDDYIITQYVGGGTTTTTYHRRAAKNVRVGGLTTARNINGTAFDGTANITTANWGTTRSLTIGNKAQDVNGSAAVTWSLNDILLNATQIGTATSWDQVGPSVYYVASSSAFTGTNHPGNNSEQMPYTYGQLIVSRAGSGGILQVYASHHASNSGAINEGLRYRTGWNSAGWQAWSTILDDRLWRKYIFANKNIGRTTLTVTDSTWSVTSGTDVFGLSFKDTGLTYTPSGGSATASSDTGDWRAWLTCAADSNTVMLNMRIDGSFQANSLITGTLNTSSTATFGGDLLFSNSATNTRQIRGVVGDNDYWRIAGGATAANAGWMEIATADDGNEPIYVRQYTGAYTTITRTATLLDGNGNSSFPGNITCIGAPQTVTAANMAFNGGVQLREVGAVGNTQSAIEYGPRLSFHWSNRIAKSITLHSDGKFYFRDQNGTTRSTIDANLTGTADVASKLGTANVGGANRPIYLSGGTATAVSWYHNSCTISGGNKANYPWHRFAYCTTGTGQWTDKTVIVIIHGRYNGGPYGMVKLSMRTNATNAAKSTSAVWIYRSGFAVDDIKISAPTKTTGTDETISAYIKCDTYPRRIAYILEGSNLGWTLVSSNEPNNTTTSDKKGGTEINASVSGNNATDSAIVSYANSAGSSASCTGNAATATTASYANVINNDGGRRTSSEYMHADGKMRFYLATSSMTTGKPPTGDGFIIKGGWDNTSGWDAMISWSNSGHASVRGSSGSGNATNHTQSWNAWNTILDSNNYTSYTVTKTGSGASGSWGISVTGSSASCTGNSNTANYQNCVQTNEIRYARNGNMASANDLWQGWAFAEGKVAVINGWRFGNGNGALAPIYGSKIYNAIWNDFAEYRESDVFEGGRVLVSDGHGKLVLATERLQPAARVISDTFGCSVGQSDKAKTPIGVAGRVLVYPYQDRNNYKVGDCLCAAPNGTADIMTREEIINYPDRIIGIVDEIPTYEVWQQSLTNYKKKDNGEIDEIGEKNTTDTKVNGRIWIYVR